MEAISTSNTRQNELGGENEALSPQKIVATATRSLEGVVRRHPGVIVVVSISIGVLLGCLAKRR